jgi:hypothetical protein
VLLDLLAAHREYQCRVFHVVVSEHSCQIGQYIDCVDRRDIFSSQVRNQQISLFHANGSAEYLMAISQNSCSGICRTAAQGLETYHISPGYGEKQHTEKRDELSRLNSWDPIWYNQCHGNKSTVPRSWNCLSCVNYMYITTESLAGK